ncbi:Chondroadherin-like protein, partial [Stegodyphus mimosarum]
MWFLKFFGIFGAASVILAGVPECPPSQKVYPCFCTNDGLLTSIDCEGLGSLQKISDVMKNIKGQNLSFAFWKSNLGDIPSNFFEGFQSVNLHFENCKIGSFGDRPFTGLENSLKNIYVYGSVDKRKKDLETFPLGHLKKLKDLYFEANDIKRLGNDWFEGGPESLEQLMLEANDIEELGDKAFASLINMTQIWLGDNRFKKVSRSMFPNPANKLELLEMSFNGIEELPEDMFEGMPRLTSINVSGNKLKTVPEATWGKIWDQLNEVYLERNSGFVCDENMKWIYQRKLPKILTGRCTGGNKLSGKEIKSLTLADFD